MSGFVNVETHLLTVEFHCALVKTILAQDLGKPVESKNLLRQLTFTFFNNLLRLLVSEPPHRACHRTADAVIKHSRFIIHLEYA